jgi:hypothetical protein
MKAFASSPSDPGSRSVPAWPALALAVAYLAAHLPILAPSLEDIDSINFALGLHDYDLARHQPHPPGYPVFIALGRVSRAVLSGAAPGLDPTKADALALAWWSAIGGALAIVGTWALVREAQARYLSRRGTPLWTAALLAVSPLFWLTGLRPMSDSLGLGVTVCAQALIVRGFRPEFRRPSWLVAGAALAGIGMGIRVQSAALTLPLLAVAVIAQGRGWWRAGSWAGAVLVAAICLWAVPMLAATGGLDGYLAALGSQAGEDFAWVDMLWLNPTPRRLALSLFETFAQPWALPLLAGAIVIAAGTGVVAMAAREPRALGVLAVAFAPYALFHLLLQETATVRYALPLLPGVAWLAARGVASAGRLAAPLCFVLAASAAFESIPAGTAYGTEVHPAFRAIRDMTEEAEGAPPHAVYAHYALYRPLQTAAGSSLPVVPPLRNREWLGPSEYWLGGGAATVWFLAEPRRSDLDLIDPASRHVADPYPWYAGARPELGGARPIDVAWYRFGPPGWFATAGWSLSPETGGQVRATRSGLDHRPIEAFVRRRREATTIMIGGAYLGDGPEPPVTLAADLDGTPIAEWTLEPRQAGQSFLHFLSLPDGIPAGQGAYARLRLTARPSTPRGAIPELAIRQFDAQSGRPVMGLAEGWHQDESDPATGRRWRWTSDRSTLRIVGAGDVSLVLRGESPMKYYDEAPRVRIMAGDRLLAEYHPDADFTWHVPVPADALAASGGTIVIDMDRAYLPGRVEGTSDTRRLGLRIVECAITPEIARDRQSH